MTKLSPAREGIPLLEGLELLSRGKVRDSYLLRNGKILQVATDAISIFDFTLNATIPQKGTILTAMSHFWFKMLESYGIKTHFIADGADIDQYLPNHLKGNVDLQSRALVVERLEMADIEFVVRACLTGSGKTSYDKNGTICGHKLPSGLQDGDELPCLIDTPTTKSTTGHDEHVSAEAVRSRYPEQTYLALQIFQIAQAYAKSKGIILADTKFEFSKNSILADEVLTPDSSRYWDFAGWLASRKPADNRKAPTSCDKQFVRAWGIGAGVNKRNPEDTGDVNYVQSLIVPDGIIARTTQIYCYIFWRLTGMTIEQYLNCVMKVAISERPAKRVLIICGSESDLSQVKEACELHAALKDPSTTVKITVHIMSCHRNPYQLEKYICRNVAADKFDVVIGIGSKALALPGIIDAWCHTFRRNVLVAGVALGELGSKALQAAQLSIEELPGQPVIINEITGQAYTGVLGLRELLERIDSGELPPAKERTEKLVQMRIWQNY
jgi:phosphoribosylaminoimidazole-succinocarboxamide synthase